jgi:hypothetical protein
MQHATRTTSDIDDPLAQVDPDLFELRVGIWGEVGNLPLESPSSGTARPKR